jgi:subtilisin-like proprotein convertase family protein
VISHITVPETFAITAVQLLNLRVQHPDTGELVVTLHAPDGRMITPLIGICPGAHNWKALSLIDYLPRTVGQACQDDLDDGFRPLDGQALAQFAGHPAQGDWTLQVIDTRSGNSGTLIGWSLLFTDTVTGPPTATPESAPPPDTAPGPPPVERGPDGRYLSTDLNTPGVIPDNAAAGIVSHILVPDTFTVRAVQLLNLRVQHPNTGDLVVTLRAPDGTTITPVKGICPGARNWKALSLADGLARTVGEVCQDDLDDAFHPPAGQELARFKGHPAQGDWTLHVVDIRPGNSGTLIGWSLLFTDTEPSPATATPEGGPAPEETPGGAPPSERGADGRYLSSDLDSPRDIPDNDTAGAVSRIVVPEHFLIETVQLLNLRVVHPDTGELVVTLRAPDGTMIMPINGICAGAHNWHALTLADGLPRGVGEVCQDDLDDGFHPPAGQELAHFAGHQAQGEWVLQVVDTRPGNSGTLVGWSLLFTAATPKKITLPTPVPNTLNIGGPLAPISAPSSSLPTTLGWAAADRLTNHRLGQCPALSGDALVAITRRVGRAPVVGVAPPRVL